MNNCHHCEQPLTNRARFCTHCGTKVPLYRILAPRQLAIALLSLFIIIGIIVLGSPRQVPETQPWHFTPDNIAAGTLSGLSLSPTTDDDVLEQWTGVTDSGYPVTVFRHKRTRQVVGVYVSSPPVSDVTISEGQALERAQQFLSACAIASDPKLTLTVQELVPDDLCYYLRWQAVDPDSGALLIRRVDICVNAETGDIISFVCIDGGKTTIDTTPHITDMQAESIAINAVREYVVQPEIIDCLLYVSIIDNHQRLLWLIVIKDSDSDPPFWLHVTVDAQHGQVISINY